jgi:RND family efflux transporter MFP subunit
VAVVAVALAVWQAQLLLTRFSGSQRSPVLDTALVRKGDFAVGVTREGTLKSTSRAQVRAPTVDMSLALTWVITDGMKVKEGDPIAKLDLSAYKFSVESQRLDYQGRFAQVAQERRDRTRDLESADMDMDKALRGLDMLLESHNVEREQAQAQIGYDDWRLKWAQTDYNKQEGLQQEGIVPSYTVELADRKVRSREFALTRSEKEEGYLGAKHSSTQVQSKADIDTARFEAGLAKDRIATAVKSTQDRADLARERLSEMEKEMAGGELKAPQAGVVVLDQTWDRSTHERRAIREGDQVWSRQVIADITDLSQLEVNLRVEESAVPRLKVGQETLITVVGVSDWKFRGRVKTIGAMARRVMIWEDPNAPTDQGCFDVKVEVLDPDLKLLRPGMRAKVQFVFEKVPAATYVPLEAVHEKPGGEVVYVLGRNGFAARRVKTGKRNDESVVIAAGLKPGERVALSDPARAEAQ